MVRTAYPFQAREQFVCGFCESAKAAGPHARLLSLRVDSDDSRRRNDVPRGVQDTVGQHGEWEATLGPLLFSRSRNDLAAPHSCPRLTRLVVSPVCWGAWGEAGEPDPGSHAFGRPPDGDNEYAGFGCWGGICRDTFYETYQHPALNPVVHRHLSLPSMCSPP